MEEMLIQSTDVTSLYHYHALDFVLAALNTDDPRLYERLGLLIIRIPKFTFFSVLSLVERMMKIDPYVMKKKGVLSTIKARQKLKNEKLLIEERILNVVVKS